MNEPVKLREGNPAYLNLADQNFTKFTFSSTNEIRLFSVTPNSFQRLLFDQTRSLPFSIFFFLIINFLCFVITLYSLYILKYR